jgi:hypothetical protein
MIFETEKKLKEGIRNRVLSEEMERWLRKEGRQSMCW